MPREQAKPLVINVRLEGATDTLRAFGRLPKDASAELRDAANDIAQDMVMWIRAGAAQTPQSWLMEPTIKARRDRVPVVEVGGTKKVGHRKTPAYKILFGANFGARFYPQFRPWAGVGKDYFIFKPIDTHAREISDRWGEAADRILAKWAEGGNSPGPDTLVIAR